MIFARKINKIPEFYMRFAGKMLEFYTIMAQKYFSPFFFGGGRAPTPPPVSYAYASQFFEEKVSCYTDVKHANMHPSK